MQNDFPAECFTHHAFVCVLLNLFQTLEIARPHSFYIVLIVFYLECNFLSIATPFLSIAKNVGVKDALKCLLFVCFFQLLNTKRSLFYFFIFN